MIHADKAGGGNPFLLAIASGKGGTGKTLVATNVAVLAAASGLRVALADCAVEAPNETICSCMARWSRRRPSRCPWRRSIRRRAPPAAGVATRAPMGRPDPGRLGDRLRRVVRGMQVLGTGVIGFCPFYKLLGNISRAKK